MEYTQWEENLKARYDLAGLNPCCNGIYSMSKPDIQYNGKQLKS